MEFRQLECFVAAASEASFSRAAKQLGCVESAITGQIKRLEEELGVSLFARTGRGVALTSAGRHLLIEAKETLSARERVWNAAGFVRQEVPKLKLAAYESILTYRLPIALKKYLERYGRHALSLVSVR